MSATVTDLHLLSLMQLCDSNFPTGAFSHSFGLETYIQEDRVSSKQTFYEWLQAYVNEQLVYTDGLASRLTYEALEQNQVETVWNLDRLMTVQNFPRESREGSRRMGEGMLRLGSELYESPQVRAYRERVKAKQSSGHPAIVFALLAHHLEIPKKTAVLSYLYSTTAALIQNGVRAIPLGQTEGQRLQCEMQPLLLQAVELIEQLDPDDLGIVTPGLELAQMRHEQLNIRIFSS
ncbi:urease accessory protein UreF [Brevibacillus reuszeri]|uniref:urease accessory protein UreF n=1 Tax=Brevibacillus reuszeri TaxID=54915 RepID=UPI0028A10DB7|nr:urease accessory protein UreF [Brevibacillus reuszeri]